MLSGVYFSVQLVFIPHWENIAARKTCPVGHEEFVITDHDLEFYDSVSPIFWGKKYSMPTPILSPDERQRRRISFRNFRSLYRRKCDATGKSIVSMYHKEQPFPVYDNEHWWSDAWEWAQYGIGVDFDRPFFDQYKDLVDRVPRTATMNFQSSNCQYSNPALHSNDCYLVFGCVRNENCLYGHIVWDSHDCMDNLYASRCRQCSECVDCMDCHGVHFSTECVGCTDSYFLHDCQWCSDCFGCTNLRNQSCCFFNEQLTQKQYKEKIQSIDLSQASTLQKGKAWLEKNKRESCVFPELFGVKNENVTWNHIYESNNCWCVFDTQASEDSKYVYTGYGIQNSYDISFTWWMTRFSYDCLTMWGSESCLFCHSVFDSSECILSEFCYGCDSLFGCQWLRKKKHCILNMSYAKNEYEQLAWKLIDHMTSTGEWGEFFPHTLSPFGYNESIAQEYRPLSKTDIESKGWNWYEYPESPFGGRAYIPLPIKEYDETKVWVEMAHKNIDECLQGVLVCDVTKRPYKVVRQELLFCIQHSLPIATRHPDQRHVDRMSLRNPRKLCTRTCDQSQKEIQTTYTPDRPERVLCEKCYYEAIY